MRIEKGLLFTISSAGQPLPSARSLNSFHPTTDPALACAWLQPSKCCRMVRVGVCTLWRGEARWDGMRRVGLW